MASLALADGQRWTLAARDDPGLAAARHLAAVMQLSAPVTGGSLLSLGGLSARQQAGLSSEGDALFYTLDPSNLRRDIPRAALAVCRGAQAHGALLVHGALACHGETGIILAGSGGSGKTTASARLPLPWQSLSDDATLVVRTPAGAYRAHPWPTWSRLSNGSEQSWDVQRSVAVAGVFFISRALEDRVQPLGAGRGVCLLEQAVDQLSWPMTRGLDPAEGRALRLQQFDNCCHLAKTVPLFLLRISLTGSFWRDVESVLESVLR